MVFLSRSSQALGEVTIRKEIKKVTGVSSTEYKIKIAIDNESTVD